MLCADLPLGAEVVLDNGDVVGSVRACAQDWALAHIKLLPALQAAEPPAGPGPSTNLFVRGSQGQTLVKVTPVRPQWWPAEWGTEEGGAGGGGDTE